TELRRARRPPREPAGRCVVPNTPETTDSFNSLRGTGGRRMSLFARQHRSAVLLAAALLVPALRSPLAAQQTKAGAPTVAEAIAFAVSTEADRLALAVRAERAARIQSTYITEDTELLAAQELEKYIAASVALATQAARYNDLDLPDDVRRKLT